MKVAPSGIIDLILGYISDSYKLYHEIPEDKDKSLATIMNVLQVAAKKFQAKHGKIPFLFIDGIDVLANKDEELVTCLLSHAKYMSNHDILKVVLISSEGSIMPLVKKFSGINRAPKIFEIVDIEESLAIDYLKDHGLSENLSAMLIDYFGGRLIYMINSITLYKAYVKLGQRDDAQLYEEIKDLFARKLEAQHYAIEQKWPKSKELLAAITQKGIISPSVLLHMQGDEGKELMDETITHLVDANIIRYTTNGLLTWHGKVEECHFKVHS